MTPLSKRLEPAQASPIVFRWLDLDNSTEEPEVRIAGNSFLIANGKMDHSKRGVVERTSAGVILYRNESELHLNGEQVDQAWLKVGDILELGGRSLQLVSLGEVSPKKKSHRRSMTRHTSLKFQLMNAVQARSIARDRMKKAITTIRQQRSKQESLEEKLEVICAHQTSIERLDQIVCDLQAKIESLATKLSSRSEPQPVSEVLQVHEKIVLSDVPSDEATDQSRSADSATGDENSGPNDTQANVSTLDHCSATSPIEASDRPQQELVRFRPIHAFDWDSEEEPEADDTSPIDHDKQVFKSTPCEGTFKSDTTPLEAGTEATPKPSEIFAVAVIPIQKCAATTCDQQVAPPKDKHDTNMELCHKLSAALDWARQIGTAPLDSGCPSELKSLVAEPTPVFETPNSNQSDLDISTLSEPKCAVDAQSPNMAHDFGSNIDSKNATPLNIDGLRDFIHKEISQAHTNHMTADERLSSDSPPNSSPSAGYPQHLNEGDVTPNDHGFASIQRIELDCDVKSGIASPAPAGEIDESLALAQKWIEQYGSESTEPSSTADPQPVSVSIDSANPRPEVSNEPLSFDLPQTFHDEPQEFVQAEDDGSCVFSDRSGATPELDQFQNDGADELNTYRQESVADILAKMRSTGQLDPFDTVSEDVSNSETFEQYNPDNSAQNEESEVNGLPTDPSVQEYMSQLLDRLKSGSSNPENSATIQEGKQTKSKSSASRGHSPREQQHDSLDPLKSDEFKPRQSASEQSEVLENLRQVANQSTRSAVNTSIRKKNLDLALYYLAGAGVSLGLAIIVIFQAKSLLDPMMLGAFAGILASAFCCYKYLITRGVISIAEFEWIKPISTTPPQQHDEVQTEAQADLVEAQLPQVVLDNVTSCDEQTTGENTEVMETLMPQTYVEIDPAFQPLNSADEHTLSPEEIVKAAMFTTKYGKQTDCG